MSYSAYIMDDMDYEPDIDASVSLYELVDGTAGYSLCDLRYSFALALGAAVVTLVLAAWGVRKMRVW